MGNHESEKDDEFSFGIGRYQCKMGQEVRQGDMGTRSEVEGHDYWGAFTKAKVIEFTECAFLILLKNLVWPTML